MKIQAFEVNGHIYYVKDDGVYCDGKILDGNINSSNIDWVSIVGRSFCFISKNELYECWPDGIRVFPNQLNTKY